MKAFWASTCLVCLLVLTAQSRAEEAGTAEIIQAIENVLDEKFAEADEHRATMRDFLEENVVKALERMEAKADEALVKQAFFEYCLFSDPCGEHGTCSVVNDTAHCTCDEGYEGTPCEVKDPCADSECLNEGVCVPDAAADTYTCTCPYPFSGDRCQVKGPCAIELERDPPTRPVCDEQGFFASIQAHGRRSVCVDRVTGRPIMRASRRGPSGRPYMIGPDGGDDDSCKCAQAEADAGSGPDAPRFICDFDGGYRTARRRPGPPA